MKTVRALGIFALIFLAAYLIGSFVAWDLDPGEWATGARAFVAFVATAFGFAAVAMAMGAGA